MKRKAYRRERKRIRKLFQAWNRKLGLGWWDLEVCYADTEKGFKRTDGSVAAMRTVADWRYLTVYITVNVPGCARLEDWQLENTVVHELVHALVNEMREQGIDHEERVVTSLAKAFIWVRDLTRDESKPK